jgi:rhomboid family GlyGly-CTERM serine protease
MQTRALPWITFSCAAIAWLLHRVPAAATALEFQQTAVSRGELWRIATSHFVHFNDSHLRWDLIGLVILGAWAETISRRRWVVALGVAAVVIPVLVGWFEPQLTSYRGLSGLACVPFGLIVVALIRSARRHGDTVLRVTAWIATLGFLGKTAYEMMVGQTLFAEAGMDFVPVPLAHLTGFLIGIATALPRADAVTPSAQSPCRRGAGCNGRGRRRGRPPAWRFRWRPARAGACPGR